MSRRRALAVGAVGVVSVLGVGFALNAGVLRIDAAAPGNNGPAPTAAPPVKTVAAAKRTLQVTETLSGTLGYEGAAAVDGGLTGTLTWLPDEGALIEHGRRLYEVDGRRRALLLYGAVPAWRALGPDTSDGTDVKQLEVELKALGFAPKGMTVDRHWDADTTTAVKRLQRARGLTRDGVLGEGEVVFLPSALRVAERPAALGARIGPGAPVLKGTTTRRVVTVALAADRQDLLRTGAEVSVELPDGTSTKGHVASVGRVAHAPDDSSLPGGGSSSTIDVSISLDDPAAAGTLDQAPVKVHVVTESRQDVLAVPVNALVALLEGGYAVEVQAVDGTRRYVGVKLGLFQSGWVEVTSTTLVAGDKVVVPS